MTININLLPWREELKENLRREYLALLGLGGLVAFAFVLCIHMFIQRQITFQNENNEYLRNEIKILERQIAEIQGLQKEKQELLARMEIIQQLQSSRPEIVRLFDTIARTVPEGIYLTSLSRSGTTVTIDGETESNTRVSMFMRNIESSKWLKSPMLTLIQMDDKQKGTKVADKQPVDNADIQMKGFHLQATQVTEAPLETKVLEDKSDNATKAPIVKTNVKIEKGQNQKK